MFLLGLSGCYVVLYSPKLVMDLVRHSVTDGFYKEHLAHNTLYVLTVRVAEAMYLSNSLVNLFVYSSLSPSFRRHLAKLFFIHLQAWRDSLESLDTRATSVNNGLSLESLDNLDEPSNAVFLANQKWSSSDGICFEANDPNQPSETDFD